MRMHSIRWPQIIVLEPRRQPADVTDGLWRMDVVHDDNARSRLLDNLRHFTSERCHAKVMQQLIAEEPEDGHAVRQMNSRSMTQAEAAAVEKYGCLHGLNDSQQKAMRSTFTSHLSLVQGPPGTGKTSLSVAILAANKELHRFVSSCAPSNLGIDEIVARLVKKGVAVARYGDWRCVAKHLQESILHVTIEHVAHTNLEHLSAGGGGIHWRQQ